MTENILLLVCWGRLGHC